MHYSKEEKMCACGAQLTRIGEDICEKLEIIEPRMYVNKQSVRNMPAAVAKEQRMKINRQYVKLL